MNTENIKYCTFLEQSQQSFFFDHVHIFPQDQITFHQHVGIEISYIIKGKGKRVIGDTIQDFAAGELIFIPSNLPHYWSFDAQEVDTEGKIENITLIFKPEFITTLQHFFTECTTVMQSIASITSAIVLTGKDYKKIAHLMLQMKHQNNLERLSTLLLVLQTVANANKNNCVGKPMKHTKTTEKMQHINRYVICNYHKNITVADVAKTVHMNTSSFCVFFKREKGKTFVSFLNEFRIQSACKMLEETSLSIAEICYAVGFNDVPHFTRTFKKIKAITPSKYRTQNQKVSA